VGELLIFEIWEVGIPPTPPNDSPDQDEPGGKKKKTTS